MSGPALHHAIMIVDVARFGDPARTNIHQLVVRQAMYEALERSFAEADTPWEDCRVEDRGDGAMILIPACVPKAQLAERVPARLVAALRRHNAVSADETRIKLRVAFHSGELHIDPHGVAGTALNFAFRLVEAPVLKSALMAPECTVGLIVSAAWYDDVVRHDPAAEPESYRQVSTSVKETTATAWMRLFDAGSTRAPEPSPETRREDRAAPIRLSPGDQLRLADALLTIPAIRDQASRRLLLELLRPEIADSVPYHSVDRFHVINIVRTCLLYEGGLEELVEAVRGLDGGSAPYAHAVRLVRELSSPPQRPAID